jgi:hypothetical protein
LRVSICGKGKKFHPLAALPLYSMKNIPFGLGVFLAAVVAGCMGREATMVTDLHKKRPTSPIVKRIQHFVRDSAGEMLFEAEDFNKKGLKTRTIRYQAPNMLDFEATYTRDEEGNPIKAVTRYLDGSTETESHKYNREGKAISTEWKRSDGSYGRHEYKYDERDSLVQWERYENGKYLMTQLWPNAYDEEGRVSEAWYKETNNGHDTSTQAHWQYQYDSLGRMIHRMTLSGPALQYAEQFHYDSLGSPIMIIELGLDSTRPGTYVPQKRTINLFNEYGELLRSQVLDVSGKELNRLENEYDQYGHLIRSVRTNMEGEAPVTETHRWEYEYY